MRTRSSEVELAAHNRSVHGSIPCGSTTREVAPYHRRKPNWTEPKGRKSEDDGRVHSFPSSSGQDTGFSTQRHGFDSRWERHAAVAQMAEHLICNHVVAGSIPASGSNGIIAQLVEHRTFNPVVVGSSPTGPTNRGQND